ADVAGLAFAPRDLPGDPRAFPVGQAVAAHARVAVHQRVQRDAVAGGHRVVVEVVRAGGLRRAGAEVRIRIVAGDDRDQAAVLPGADRDLAQLADDGRIARIVRVHRHGAVAQHRFRARGGDGNVVARLAERDVAVGV